MSLFQVRGMVAACLDGQVSHIENLPERERLLRISAKINLALLGLILIAVSVTPLEIYTNWFRHHSTELVVIESVLFLAFGVELLARLVSFGVNTQGRERVSEGGFLLLDGLVVYGSWFAISAFWTGDQSGQWLMSALAQVGIDANEMLIGVFRFVRLVRMAKLIRQQHVLQAVFGRRVLTVVFGPMMAYFGLWCLMAFVLDIFPTFRQVVDPSQTLVVSGMVFAAMTIMQSLLLGRAAQKTEQLRGDLAELFFRFSQLAQDLRFCQTRLQPKEGEGEEVEVAEISVTRARAIVLAFLQGQLSDTAAKQQMLAWEEECQQQFAGALYHLCKTPVLQSYLNSVSDTTASAVRLMAVGTHHNPKAMYRFLHLMGSLLLTLVAYSLAIGIAGFPGILITTFVVLGLTTVIDDLDHAFDPEKSLFNLHLFAVSEEELAGAASICAAEQ